MELKVNLTLTPEVRETIDTAEIEVGKILSEIKDELIGSNDLAGSAVDLNRSTAETAACLKNS
jgi:hypothetical protein